MNKNFLLSLLACVALTGNSFAQGPTINTAFHLPGFDIQGKRITLLKNPTVIPGSGDCDPGFLCEKIVFSNSLKKNTDPSFDRFLLISTDFNGNYISGHLMNFEMEKHHIITTHDNGLLVAGLPNQQLPSGNCYLVVLKFDFNLNLQWSKKIPLSSRHVSSSENGFENVGIEKIFYEESDQEHYYIAFNNGYPDDQNSRSGTISAIRMDQDGNLIWHKTYYNPGWVNLTNNGVIYKTDGVNDITFYNDEETGKKLFCISGTTRTFFNDVFNSVDNRIFYMSIDEDGLIAYSYRTHHLNHYEYKPDLIWDGNYLVSTFYREFPSAPIHDRNSISITRLNPDLSLVDNHEYKSYTNYTFAVGGISMDRNNNYIISCISERLPYPKTVTDKEAGFIIIDNSSMLATIFEHQHTGSHYNYVNQKHFSDDYDNHYFVPSVIDPILGGPTYIKPRLIKVNSSLYACKQVNDEIFTEPSSVGRVDHFLLSDFEQYETEDFPFGIEDYNLTQDYCYGSQPNYRISQNQDENESVSVYPNLLTNEQRFPLISLVSKEAGTAEVIITDVLGKPLHRETFRIVEGENKFKIETGFVSGINIIKVVLNGKPLESQKIFLKS